MELLHRFQKYFANSLVEMISCTFRNVNKNVNLTVCLYNLRRNIYFTLLNKSEMSFCSLIVAGEHKR